MQSHKSKAIGGLPTWSKSQFGVIVILGVAGVAVAITSGNPKTLLRDRGLGVVGALCLLMACFQYLMQNVWGRHLAAPAVLEERQGGWLWRCTATLMPYSRQFQFIRAMLCFLCGHHPQQKTVAWKLVGVCILCVAACVPLSYVIPTDLYLSRKKALMDPGQVTYITPGEVRKLPWNEGMFRETSLPKVKAISYWVAKAFHDEYRLHPLSLDGVTHASNMALRMLAHRPGPLSLDGIKELNPITASYFANHTGSSLSLRGLVQLDDECAGLLARRQQILYLSPRTRITEKGLDMLRKGRGEVIWKD